MRRRTALPAALMLVLGSTALWAHDGHAHTIRGVVTARDARHVEVKTPGGETLSIALNAKTAVVRDKRKAAITEVQIGRRVIVDIGNGEDPLIAREIRVGIQVRVAQVATR